MNDFKAKLKTSLGANLIIATYTVVIFLSLTHIVTIFTSLSEILSYISPFFVAIGIAFIFNMPMKAIEKYFLNKFKLKYRMKRAISILITFVFFFIIATALVMFIVPQIKVSIIMLLSSIQGYVLNFETLVSEYVVKYEIPDEIVSVLNVQFDNIIELITLTLNNIIPYTLNFTIQAVNGTFNLIMSFILSIYMLSDKENLITNIKKVIYSIFSRNISDKIFRVSSLANSTFSSFIGGQLTEACILGSLATIGTLVLKLDYAFLIGTIMGVFAVIPIVGAFAGATICAILLMIISPMKAVVFVIFITVLQQIEGNVIYPRVVGNSIGISGMWIIFAMLLGGGLYGVKGVFLGIPLFAVIYVLVSEWTNNRLRAKNLLIINRKVYDKPEPEETIEENV